MWGSCYEKKTVALLFPMHTEVFKISGVVQLYQIRAPLIGGNFKAKENITSSKMNKV